MALITCAGADVERLELHWPQRGPWFARLKLDTATAPSGKVTIAAAGGLSATGTVIQPSGVQLDSAFVRIVGGGGGLSSLVTPAAFEAAQLRDPLNAILGAAGETLSPTVSSDVLSVLLPQWTHVAQRLTTALDLLAYAAAAALGQAIGWRVLSDGSIWLGAETWPTQSLPSGDDVLSYFPDEGRYEIGATTPSLLPGVNLSDINSNVISVDHFVVADEVRTWAWV